MGLSAEGEVRGEAVRLRSAQREAELQGLPQPCPGLVAGGGRVEPDGGVLAVSEPVDASRRAVNGGVSASAAATSGRARSNSASGTKPKSTLTCGGQRPICRSCSRRDVPLTSSHSSAGGSQATALRFVGGTTEPRRARAGTDRPARRGSHRAVRCRRRGPRRPGRPPQHHPVPGDLPARHEVAEQDALRWGPALRDPHHEPLGIEPRVPEHTVVDLVAGVHVGTCPRLSGCRAPGGPASRRLAHPHRCGLGRTNEGGGLRPQPRLGHQGRSNPRVGRVALGFVATGWELIREVLSQPPGVRRPGLWGLRVVFCRPPRAAIWSLRT
ncbi:hypothetical protein STANM309S_04912 [Streptomyces tanashiensis]